jgi:tRNA dimethylallyltransferase
VNGDAMQMYKGLPIITNQIPVHERHGIPHHMLACIELDQPSWRITRFKREALKIIQEIRSRGKTPILVGGTHYYTQAVLFHKTILPSDQELDAASDDSAEEEKFPILEASTEEMLQKLREVDPVMAERWHPNERRKIRRSLQIYLQTGRRASDEEATHRDQQYDRGER